MSEPIRAAIADLCANFAPDHATIGKGGAFQRVPRWVGLAAVAGLASALAGQRIRADDVARHLAELHRNDTAPAPVEPRPVWLNR
jgi:aminoglycoside phosphotransferase (APT) family kinase protein